MVWWKKFLQFAQSDLFNQIIIALLILVATAILAHVVARMLRRLLHSQVIDVPSATIFVNIARIAIWLFGICIMLPVCFNVDVTAAIAALGIGGLAVSLGAKDTISNFLGGVQVSIMGIVKPGDNICVGETSGEVKDVNWRQTVVIDSMGNEVLIPNSVMNASIIEKLPPMKRQHIYFVLNTDGQALDELAYQIEQTATQAILKIDALVYEPTVFLSEISAWGVRGKLTFEVRDEKKIWTAVDAVVRAIAPLVREGFVVTDKQQDVDA